MYHTGPFPMKKKVRCFFFYLPASRNLPNNWDFIFLFIKAMFLGPCRKKWLFSIENWQIFINPKPYVIHISDSVDRSHWNKEAEEKVYHPWTILSYAESGEVCFPSTLSLHFSFMCLCPGAKFGAGLRRGSRCQRKTYILFYIHTNLFFNFYCRPVSSLGRRKFWMNSAFSDQEWRH